MERGRDSQWERNRVCRCVVCMSSLCFSSWWKRCFEVSPSVSFSSRKNTHMHAHTDTHTHTPCISAYVQRHTRKHTLPWSLRLSARSPHKKKKTSTHYTLPRWHTARVEVEVVSRWSKKDHSRELWFSWSCNEMVKRSCGRSLYDPKLETLCR